ncbi:MAG: hypothetical protein AABY46_01765 [Nitrospirota bacterium]
MPESILTILSSLTFSGILTALLLFLTRSWLSERLKQSIEHEYAQKLETYKHALRAEHEIAIERLRASNAQERAVQSTATSSFAESHRAAHERRLAAIEITWKAIFKLRSVISPALLILDYIPSDKQGQLLTNSTMREFFDKLSMKTLNEIFSEDGKEADVRRPFVSEGIYSLWSAYRSLIALIYVMTIAGKIEGKIDPWHQNLDIRKLLSEIMTTQEFEQFSQLIVGRLQFMSDTIDRKILTQMRLMVSGEESGAIGLEQAQKISDIVTRLDQKRQADSRLSEPAV